MRTSSSGWVKTLWALAEAQGVNTRELFVSTGLNEAQLNNPYFRYPQKNISHFWQTLSQQTNNPAIGLEFGKYVTPATFNAVGYVFLTSANLKQSLTSLLRYQRYLAEALRCDFQQTKNGYWLTLENIGDKDGVPVQTIEAMLSAFIYYARWVAQEAVIPAKLQIKHTLTCKLEQYQRIFSCPIETNAKNTGFLFDAETIEHPIRAGDPNMFSYHTKIADEVNSRTFQTITCQVKTLILQLLPHEAIKQGQIAAMLHLTSKTLQRRLDAENTQFKTVVENCRFERASQYLQQPHIALQEVAELAGYADYSAFAKAFKRWSSESPADWRKRHL